MRKAGLNLVVDVTSLVGFVLLAWTGVMMRYVLPPGAGHFRTLWGLSRHQWGEVHFWTAVGLMLTLGLHLFLHWRWIVTMVRGQPREGSRLRVTLAMIGVLTLVALLASPFLGPVETAGELPHRQHLPGTNRERSQEITGSMTLRDVEEQTGAPVSILLRELHLPAETSSDVQLGQLRKQHHFDLHELRRLVQQHRNQR